MARNTRTAQPVQPPQPEPSAESRALWGTRRQAEMTRMLEAIRSRNVRSRPFWWLQHAEAPA